jgi:two-component system chemotaxis response regulator CheB
VTGVVLSGVLDNCTSGLRRIKRFDSNTIVQDPHEVSFDSMPPNALEQVDLDHTQSTKEIGPLMARLVRGKASEMTQSPDDVAERMRIEIEVVVSANAFKRGIMKYGELTHSPAPNATARWSSSRKASAPVARHTGHGFTASAMLVGITEAVEPSLWKVTRALKESVWLLDDMARHLADAGRPKDAERFFQKARVTEKRAHALQELTIKHPQLSQDALRDSIGETCMKPRES